VLEWCIEYAAPPALWVLGSEGRTGRRVWYRLMSPAQWYEALFESVLVKFRIATVLLRLLKLYRTQVSFALLEDEVYHRITSRDQSSNH